MAAKMYFKKGDGITHSFKMPASSWSSGGTLFFAAKTAPDDDITDASAVIKKSFTDSVVTDETISGVAHKVYTLAFISSDTDGVTFTDGSKKKKYFGEFQWKPSSGDPSSFPADDEYIDVTVFADINRRVS